MSGIRSDDIYRVAALLAADMAIYPEVYSKPAGVEKFCLDESVQRNSALLNTFASFFAGMEGRWDRYACTIPDLTGFFQNISPDHVLHVPGQIYEAAISAASPEGLPSKQKKQGSYYTPVYIVRYMVRHSCALISGSGENSALLNDFRVIDPACGGASFLLEVFRYRVEQGLPAADALTSVFGVDIDGDAVALTRFILAAAVTARDRAVDLTSLKQCLESQIKAGNALFSATIPGRQRGFDLVIGNPPYVSNKLIPRPEKEYYRSVYRSAAGQYDLAVPFIEQGLNLLKPDGMLCYITSNKFLAADYGKNIRQDLVNKYRILALTDVSTLKPFRHVAAYPVIITIRKTEPAAGDSVSIARISEWDEIERAKPARVDQNVFRHHGDYLLTTQLDEGLIPLLNKITDSRSYLPRKVIRCGLAETGFNRWVTGSGSAGSENGHFRPFIGAGSIKPYNIDQTGFINISRLSSRKWQNLKGPKLVIPGIAKRLMAAIDYSDCLLGRVYYVMEQETAYDIGFLAVLFNSYLLNFYYSVMYWPVHLEGGYLRFNSTYLANLPLFHSLYAGVSSLAKEIAETGYKITRCPDQKQGLATMAEARVFMLYGLNTDEADNIMCFLGVKCQERAEVILLMREDSRAGEKNKQ